MRYGQKNYGRLGENPHKRRDILAQFVGFFAGVSVFGVLFFAVPQQLNGGHLLLSGGVALVAWFLTKIAPL